MKDETKALPPKLRFPEFRGTSWGTTRLDAIAQPITERAGSQRITPYTVTTGVGLVSQQDRFGRTIAGSAFQNYYVLRRDDFAYNKSATKAYPQGYIARFPGNEGAVPNSIFTCFRVDPDLMSPAYLDYLFAGNLHGKWLRRYIEVSARAHGSLSVDDADLMSLPVPVPEGTSSLAEQRKIAACLTSLDGWIAAEGRKLEALRAHKKALTQQLFPREGETRPRLRFPECRGAHGWKTYRFFDLLHDVLDFRGRTPSKLGMEWGSGEIISLSANNVKNGYIDYKAECNLGSEALYSRWMGNTKLEKGDIVFTMEAPLGNALLVPDSRKYILSQRVVAFKTKPGVASEFLIQLIWEDRFQTTIDFLATGSTAKGISQKALQGVQVALPEEPEQRRIAACLSSLDALIAAQLRKMDGLRAHKKGLMQRLFPWPEGFES